MAKYEILIGGKDQTEAHRYNKGDILAIRPHPWNWGAKEIKIGLVVIAESTKTMDEMKTYEDFIFEHDISKAQIKGNEYRQKREAGTDAGYKLKRKCINNIDLVELRKTITDLNDTKMEDKAVIYQPCKKASQLVQKFDGLNGSRLVEEKDVDTVSSVAAKEAEISINIDSVTLIKSNMA